MLSLLCVISRELKIKILNITISYQLCTGVEIQRGKLYEEVPGSSTFAKDVAVRGISTWLARTPTWQLRPVHRWGGALQVGGGLPFLLNVPRTYQFPRKFLHRSWGVNLSIPGSLIS